MYTHAGSQNYQQLRRGGLSTVSRRRPPLRSSEHDGRDGQLRSRAREPRREERRPVGSGPSETTAVGRRRRSRRGPPARTRAPAFRNIAHDTHDVSPGGRGPPPAAPRVRNTQPSGRQKKHRGCCVYGGSAALACPHPALTQPRAWPSGMSLTLCASLRVMPHALRKSSRSSSTKRAFITATTWFCTSTNSCISAYTVLSRSAGSLRCGARRTIYRQQEASPVKRSPVKPGQVKSGNLSIASRKVKRVSLLRGEE